MIEITEFENGNIPCEYTNGDLARKIEHLLMMCLHGLNTVNEIETLKSHIHSMMTDTYNKGQVRDNFRNVPEITSDNDVLYLNDEWTSFKTNDPDTREKLAEYAHAAWTGWMKYMFAKFQDWDENGNIQLSPYYLKCWLRQMDTEYHDLPEDEKESDRKEADKIMSIYENQR